LSVMADQETHVCAGCQKALPLSSFSASAPRQDGYCRDCRRNYQRDYMGAARRARREVEELRERIGSLQETVAQLARKAA
jgi:hypothetical protein